MRRPSSSSCLLLPRGSYDEGDTNNADSTTSTSPTSALSPNSNMLLSVTLLSKDKLPSYSSERFFLLAEVEVHAQPTTFLHNPNGTDESTQASDDTLDDEPLQPQQQQSLPPVSLSPLNGGNLILSSNGNGVLSVADAARPSELGAPEELGPQQQTTAECWPPYILLYLLWRPNHTKDPAVFTESHILDAVMRLQEVVDLETTTTASDTVSTSTGRFFISDQHTKDPTAAGIATANGDRAKTIQTMEERLHQPLINGVDAANNVLYGGMRGDGDHNVDSSPTTDTAPHRPKAALYIVVDRVMPVDYGDEEDSNAAKDSKEAATTTVCPIRASHAAQEDLAEGLARAVAAHGTLRSLTQGISVGVANHVRAAPGLELCVSAITLGATDRRRHSANATATSASVNSMDSRFDNARSSSSSTSNSPHLSQQLPTHVPLDPKRSLLGIVAVTPSDLLGLQDASVTDAAQGVLQSKVTAEWNGRGDLQSFAARVHNQWRRRHGIPIPSIDSYGGAATAKRKIPRRIQRRSTSGGGGSGTSSLGASPFARRTKVQLLRRNRRSTGHWKVWANVESREFLIDALAYTVIFAYIAFHHGLEIMNVLVQMSTAWNDLIRSARGW